MTKKDRLEACRRRNRRLQSLVKTAAVLTSSLDLSETLQVTLEAALDVMEAEAASVLLLDEETGELVVDSLEYQEGMFERGEFKEATRGFRVPAGKGVSGWVVRTGRTANIPDAYEDPRFHKAVDKQSGFRTKALLAVPLKIHDHILGVAEVLNRRDGGAFDREDVVMFRHFCNLVAVAVEKARLHQHHLAKEALDRELAAAREIQAAFLPTHLPELEGWRYGRVYRSAREVGGDFYDVLRCPGGLIGLVVGDVSGKGITAALLGASVAAEIRRLLQTSCSASTIVEEVNRVVRERSVRGMFVTLAVVMLDMESGAGTFASAGHLPLVHYSAESAKASTVEGFPGPPAGVLPGVSYPDAGLILKPGDRLVIYTDGLVEALDADSEEAGIEALCRSVERSAEADVLVTTGIEALAANTGGGQSQREDDLTCVEVMRTSG